MNTFVKNYWSLYLDFLDDFKDVTYKGFSIPYLCHFPKLIRKNTTIWNMLYDGQFAQQLNNQVNDQKEIQDVFNTFIQSHKKPSLIKNKEGKIVLNVDALLRFPEQTLVDYFDPSETLMIMASRQRQSGNKQTLINRTNAKMTVNGIPINYLSDYPINTKKAIIQVQNKARAVFQSYHDHHLYKEEQFQTEFLTKIAKVINCIEQSEMFLKDVSISCVVVSNTHSFVSRILAIVAAEKGIPTICMQHGIMSSEFGYIPKIATIDAVYGHFEIDWYKKLGMTDQSLEVIGHPRFDQIVTHPVIDRLTFDKQLGLDATKKTVMIVVRENRDIEKWRMLIETILNAFHVNIVIRDYPGNDPHVLTREFSSVHSTQDYHLYTIFPNVDAVVAYSSTVGLEAMLAEKQVFILNKKLPNYTGYYNGLGELVQKDPVRLGQFIIAYFNNRDWRQYAKKKRVEFLQYAYPESGSSGERLKKLINRLTS